MELENLQKLFNKVRHYLLNKFSFLPKEPKIFGKLKLLFFDFAARLARSLGGFIRSSVTLTVTFLYVNGALVKC